MCDDPAQYGHDSAAATPPDTNGNVPQRDSVIPVNQSGKPPGKAPATSQKKDKEDEVLDRVKTAERWMILLTALVALTSVFQAYESWTNNKRGTTTLDFVRNWIREEQASKDASDFESHVIPSNGTEQLDMTTISGNSRVFHYQIGQIVYWDALDPMRKHVTKFCLVNFANFPIELCKTGQDMN